MNIAAHTPGPWAYDMDFIVAPDPNGRFPDIYIAEIAHSDDEGRVASYEQQDANRHLIAAAPNLLEALKAILPYAENESAALHEVWKRDGDAKVKDELDACDRALDHARSAIAKAHIAGEEV